MSERLAFIQACLDRTERIVDICDRFGISEKTGHKLLCRFRDEGVDSLTARSHAPHRAPHRMAPEIAKAILAYRRRHPLYGAGKIRDHLRQRDPGTPWPAASSIGALLKDAGLIRPRRRPRPRGHAALDAGGTARTVATAPNQVWTADFKGEFPLATGALCYPLTVLDHHSRYLLGCTALPTTAVGPAHAVFVRLFREYGLPDVVRSDNGVPFAQPNALGRLGSLAFWWVRLGIRPEHTTPATPSENGAHERFHRTLNAATTAPPAPGFPAQQRRYDRYRCEYNTERPHASLPAHCPPATLYTPSARPYPRRLPSVEYAAADALRLVSSRGTIRWRGGLVFLSHNLAGQYVGLTATDAELVTIAYGPLALGELDPYLNRFTARVRWVGSSPPSAP